MARFRSSIPFLIAIVLVAIPLTALAVTCPSSGNCQGTSGDDYIYGNDNYNHIEANAGGDIVYAYAIGDTVEGENDWDTLSGHAGNDHVTGGENTAFHDTGIGNDGNDTVVDRFGFGSQQCQDCEHDAVCGDDGTDTLDILDGDGLDRWYGGPGGDTVNYDTSTGNNTGVDNHVYTHSECIGNAPG